MQQRVSACFDRFAVQKTLQIGNHFIHIRIAVGGVETDAFIDNGGKFGFGTGKRFDRPGADPLHQLLM